VGDKTSLHVPVSGFSSRRCVQFRLGGIPPKDTFHTHHLYQPRIDIASRTFFRMFSTRPHRGPSSFNLHHFSCRHALLSTWSIFRSSSERGVMGSASRASQVRLLGSLMLMFASRPFSFICYEFLLRAQPLGPPRLIRHSFQHLLCKRRFNDYELADDHGFDPVIFSSMGISGGVNREPVCRDLIR
jgi:hypothetical protein